MYKPPCALLLILATCTGVLGVDPIMDPLFVRCYKGSLSNYVNVLWSKPSEIIVNIDLKLPTVFYCPDFKQSCDSNSSISMAGAHLRVGGVNICLCDYRSYAALPYGEALGNAANVGLTIAESLTAMNNSGLNLDTVQCIGFGLGAEICAEIAIKLNGKLGRVTGLDPPGPLFTALNSAISANIAGQVDVIHTDAGYYGSAIARGDVDFWPNGGSGEQPECRIGYDDLCSHNMAEVFYVQSSDVPIPEAVQCLSETEFLNGSCDNNEKVAMGYALPRDASGNFYINI